MKQQPRETVPDFASRLHTEISSCLPQMDMTERKRLLIRNLHGKLSTIFAEDWIREKEMAESEGYIFNPS